MGEWCGTQRPGYLLSSGGELLVWFSSDGSTEMRGFRLVIRTQLEGKGMPITLSVCVRMAPYIYHDLYIYIYHGAILYTLWYLYILWYIYIYIYIYGDIYNGALDSHLIKG